MADLAKIAKLPFEETLISMADDYFYKLMKPRIFWGDEGVEAEHERGFESACVILSQRVSRDPKKMTVSEFMMTLAELKRQNKEQEIRSKRRGR